MPNSPVAQASKLTPRTRNLTASKLSPSHRYRPLRTYRRTVAWLDPKTIAPRVEGRYLHSRYIKQVSTSSRHSIAERYIASTESIPSTSWSTSIGAHLPTLSRPVDSKVPIVEILVASDIGKGAAAKVNYSSLWTRATNEAPEHWLMRYRTHAVRDKSTKNRTDNQSVARPLGSRTLSIVEVDKVDPNRANHTSTVPNNLATRNSTDTKYYTPSRWRTTNTVAPSPNIAGAASKMHDHSESPPLRTTKRGPNKSKEPAAQTSLLTSRQAETENVYSRENTAPTSRYTTRESSLQSSRRHREARKTSTILELVARTPYCQSPAAGAECSTPMSHRRIAPSTIGHTHT